MTRKGKEVPKEGLSIPTLIFLFCVNIGAMQDLVILPAASDIFATFPDAPLWLLNFILTGPMFLAAVTQLLAGFLMKRFTKRTLLLVCWTGFTITSCCGALVLNPWFMAVMRAISGLSIGGLLSISIALITQQYSNEKRRSRIIGFFYAAMAIIGAILSTVAGFVAVGNWPRVYFIYLVAIPVLIGLAITIPKTPIESENTQVDEGEATSGMFKEAKHPLASALATGASSAVVCIIYCAIVFQSSFLITELGLGDSSNAGVVSGISTLMSAITGIIFGFTFSKLKGFMPFMIYVFLAVGLVLIYMNPTLIMLNIAAVIMGFGYGISMPYYSAKGSMISKTNAPLYIAIVLCMTSAGNALSSYIATGLIDLMGVTMRVETIPAFIAIAVAGAVLSLINAVMVRKRQVVEAEA